MKSKINKPPYKAVILLGSDVLCSDTVRNPHCDSEILSLYDQKDRIAIGDGIKGFNLSDLKKLKGRVDQYTRIDILAHGSMTTLSHLTTINKEESITTSLLFASLKAQVDSALQVHMWQCQGGGANSDAENLGAGSTLIIHISANKNLLILPSELMIKRSLESVDNSLDLTAESILMRDIALNLITPELTIVKVNNRGTVSKQLIIRTPISTITAPKSHITEQAERLEEFSKVSADIAIITEETVREFQTGVLIYSTMTESSLPFLRSENNAILLRSLVNLALNSLYPLSVAIFSQQYKVISELFRLEANSAVRDRNGDTPAHYAVSHNDTIAINILVENRANFNLRNFKGDSPLHNALVINNTKVIDRLLSIEGLDLNIANVNRLSALNIAVTIGDTTNIKKLTAAGADVNSKDSDGYSILVRTLALAAQSGRNGDKAKRKLYIKIAKFLVDNGANTNADEQFDIYRATLNDQELTKYANELIQQTTIINKYTSGLLSTFFGLFSDKDVIQMNQFGLYKGGTGHDQFVIHKNFAGKEKGYKLVITDFHHQGEKDYLDFTNIPKLKTPEHFAFNQANYLGKKSTFVNIKSTDENLVILWDTNIDLTELQDCLILSGQTTAHTDEL